MYFTCLLIHLYSAVCCYQHRIQIIVSRALVPRVRGCRNRLRRIARQSNALTLCSGHGARQSCERSQKSLLEIGAVSRCSSPRVGNEALVITGISGIHRVDDDCSLALYLDVRYGVDIQHGSVLCPHISDVRNK